MLQDYEMPLYVHVGNIRTGMNKAEFEDSCFEAFVEWKIWKVECRDLFFLNFHPVHFII